MADINKSYGYRSYDNYISRYQPKRKKSVRGFKGIDKRTIEIISNQFIVSAGIALIIIIMSNFNAPFIGRIVNGAKWVVATNYDFKSNVGYAWDDMSSRLKDISSKESSIFGKSDAVDVSSANSMEMPVDGQITSEFGTRENPITHKKEEHLGIDIAGEKGTPIKAALDGVVEKVDENNSAGREVILKHSDGLETMYAHCSEILVKEGQQVKQGDFIAKVGDTGEATSAHLHFEVLKDGKQVNPVDIINTTVEPK